MPDSSTNNPNGTTSIGGTGSAGSAGGQSSAGSTGGQSPAGNTDSAGSTVGQGSTGSTGGQSARFDDRTPSGSGIGSGAVAERDSANSRGTKNDAALPKPQIEIIVDGNSIYKPGMKSFFINEGEDKEAVISSMGEGVITGEFCTCDVVYTTNSGAATICVCNPECACEDVCTCDGYISCSCESVCNCDGYSTCSCVSYTSTSCSCQSVSCGSPCACVPVH